MAIIASTGKFRNKLETLWRVCDNAWFGRDVTGYEQAPAILNAEFITGVNAAGTGTVNLIGVNASDQIVLPTAVVLTGGIGQTSATTGKHFYAGFQAPATATTGTDTAGVNGTVFISEIFVPANFSATGLSFLIGSVGGTDKAIAMLFSSAGAVLATSALAGVTVGTAATFQRLPFTAALTVTGPGKYFVGLQYNGATAKLRTQAGGDADVTSISQVFGTPVAIAVPTTWTVSLGPVCMLY